MIDLGPMRGKAGRFIRSQAERLAMPMTMVAGLPNPDASRSQKFQTLAKLGYRCDPLRGVVYGVFGRPLRTRAYGYMVIRNNRAACDGGTSTVLMMAHRFIWEWVYGPVPDGLEINHKNGIKIDNRIANLEVVTKSENIIHAYRNGLARGGKGAKNPMAKLTERDIVEIRRNQGATGRDLARRFGVSYAAISLIRNYKTWEHVRV